MFACAVPGVVKVPRFCCDLVGTKFGKSRGRKGACRAHRADVAVVLACALGRRCSFHALRRPHSKYALRSLVVRSLASSVQPKPSHSPFCCAGRDIPRMCSDIRRSLLVGIQPRMRGLWKGFCLLSPRRSRHRRPVRSLLHHITQLPVVLARTVRRSQMLINGSSAAPGLQPTPCHRTHLVLLPSQV